MNSSGGDSSDSEFDDILSFRSFYSASGSDSCSDRTNTMKEDKRSRARSSSSSAEEKLSRPFDTSPQVAVDTMPIAIKIDNVKKKEQGRARKVTLSPSTTTYTTTDAGPTEESLIWKRLQRILDNEKCMDQPAGPSARENELLSRVQEYGIEPYAYEVPLGNGVSDCVGVDMKSRLCVVEAKCIFGRNGTKNNRDKVKEQMRAYATFLAQETHADVAAYCFDDQGGLIALESFGVFKYETVKDNDPRGANSKTKTKIKKKKVKVAKVSKKEKEKKKKNKSMGIKSPLSWICGICTLENKELHLACAACGCEKQLN
ncbi:hypothetical protein TrST_g14176 [Triparma strigata]|uniref:RanBP2-type domain-containing protein n=1 Tax=Triparma strigata TaxID=1606541 RepID=A0A9W7A2X3_9STRA|nr:hypothetical protein TrST_g14176 [Triparma strigata]